MHAARALLAVSLSSAIAGIRGAAAEFGAPVEEAGDRLLVRLRSGTLRVSGDAGLVALDIDATEASGLQLLRDMIDDRAGALGLALDWQGAEAGRLPGNVSLARIDSVARLSPSYVRVAMSGPALARFGRGALHFRLLFGPEGAGWPMTDAGGVTRWPGGIEAWHRPVYTTRAIETLGGEAARITFDVFLHEGGRVTDWCAGLRPGAEIAISGPGGGGSHAAPWMALIGDETAVPVIARILAAAAPDMRGEAHLFVPEAADAQDLVHPAGVRIHWRLRSDAAGPLDALHALDLPARDRFVFLAAERREAFAARDWLRERGFRRGESFVSTYWTAAE